MAQGDTLNCGGLPAAVAPLAVDGVQAVGMQASAVRCEAQELLLMGSGVWDQ